MSVRAFTARSLGPCPARVSGSDRMLVFFQTMNEGRVMIADQFRPARTARVVTKGLPLIGVLLAVGSPGAYAQGNTQGSQAQSCPGSSDITLPPGFCATVFA